MGHSSETPLVVWYSHLVRTDLRCVPRQAGVVTTGTDRKAQALATAALLGHCYPEPGL